MLIVIFDMVYMIRTMAPVSMGILLFVLPLVTSQAIAGTDGELWYEIDEEIPLRSEVGNIIEDANLATEYSPDVLGQLRFSFLSPPKANFEISETTGIIVTNGRIDRDAMCPQEVTCEVKLDIAITPLDHFRTIKAVVRIQDINDNSPVFGQQELSWLLMESANQGASFPIPMATDIDSPASGIVRYTLSSEHEKFELIVISKPGGAVDLKLELTGSLDRETTDRYMVQVAAYDKDENAGFLNIRITVQDSNDHAPEFDKEQYAVTILESTDVDTTILRVRATDKDSGTNAQIAYSFMAYTESTFGEQFGIVEETGEIYVKSPLDFEQVTEYNLGVAARDMGADSISTDCNVIVTIQDVNDHAPEITVNTLTQAGTSVATISENKDPETFVAQVTVVDPDFGDNGKVNCSLNENVFMLRQKYEGEYQILTAAMLDREKTAQYNLAVLCKDAGSEPQIGIKHLQVIVGDLNDNSPKFSKNIYTASILENNYIGSYITEVNATDADAGKNGEIVYSLSADVRTLFQVHPQSGRITAKTSINREEMDQIRFHVIATDQGTPQRMTTAVVVVTIDDVNDESPKFVDPVYHFQTKENQPTGTPVGAVTASDADLNNVVTYSLNHPAFIINPVTGAILTDQLLDRETISTYQLLVIAQDNDSPPLSSSMSVTVTVLDENDHAPEFHYPSAQNFSIQVSNALPVGSTITQVFAQDEDTLHNAEISYRIQSGNEHGTFSMDPNVGAITLNSDLSALNYKVYRLMIVASDHGQPSLETETKIDIVVNASIAVSKTSSQLLSGPNFTIVISVACATGVVTVALIIAIILIRRQDNQRRLRQKHHALHFITVQEDAMKEIPQERGVGQGSGSGGKKEVSFSLDNSGVDGGGPNGPAGVDLLAGQWTASGAGADKKVRI